MSSFRDDELVLRRDEATIEMRIISRVDVDDVARLRRLLEATWTADAEPAAHAFLVVRTSSEHAFVPGVRGPLIELMRDAARFGVKAVVVVTATPVARMGSVIALAAGVPSRAVANDDELAVALEEEKAKRRTRRRRTTLTQIPAAGVTDPTRR